MPPKNRFDRSDDASNNKKPRKRRLGRPEKLEDRILMSATWADAEMGTDMPDEMSGDAADDFLVGGGGGDDLFGNGGDDTLLGGAGDDLLDGGEGTDTASFEDADGRVVVDLASGTATGEGSDTLVDIENVTGSDHNDIIAGDGVANRVEAGEGDDYVEGRGGDDTIIAGEGDDVVDAGAGDDTVAGGSGDDMLIGGEGTDTVSFGDSGAGVRVDLDAGTASGEGSDTLIAIENVEGSAHNDTIAGDGGANTLEGMSGRDTIDGGAGDDMIDGGRDNDRLSGGSGEDVIDGGRGHDRISGGTGDDVIDGGHNNDRVWGDAGDDVIEGGHGHDQLHGGDGSDVISGGDHNDRLWGGEGNDALDGGDGRDKLYGGAGDDVLDGGAGDDRVWGEDGNDTIIGGAGSDQIDGGDGDDTLTYANAGGPVSVDMAEGRATGSGTDTFWNVENVTGSSSGDTIVGDEGANVLDGGAGDDRIEGGDGADTLRGGEGDDTIIADGTDTIEGGAGTDTADFSSAASGVTLNLSDAEVEVVVGSDHDDTYEITSASDGDRFVIDAGEGWNTLDLGSFDVSDVEVNPATGVATVSLPGGGLFEVEFTGVQQVRVDGLDAPVAVTEPGMIGGENETVSVRAVALTSSIEPVTYSWTQVDGPAAILGGVDSPEASAGLPELESASTVTLKLTVSDGSGSSATTVAIGVSATNDPVVVNAGVDRIASEGDTVTLSSTVVDPEGYATVQRWEQVSGPAVTLVDADTGAPSFTAPELSEPGEVVFQLVASDGSTEVTDTVTVVIEADNDSAVVDAGEDFEVKEGKTAELRGSAVDAEGDELSYQWRQISGPAVVLSDATEQSPTFTAPEGVANTDLVFELAVSDGETTSTDSVTVTVNANDDAPRFEPTANYSVEEGHAIELSVTATDPEGNEVDYQWRQVGGPSVELAGSDTQTPSFTAPEGVTNTYITFEVTASDGEADSVRTVHVLVNADNDAPTVDAGPNVASSPNEPVSLSAAGSDPEGRALAYEWTQTGGPQVTLSQTSPTDVAFTSPSVDGPTTMTFEVRASDGENTTVDTVTVVVEPEPVVAPDTDDGSDGSHGDHAPDDSGGDSVDPGDDMVAPDPPAGPLEIEADVEIGDDGRMTVHVAGDTVDADADITWTQLSGPSDLALDGADTDTMSFAAPDLVANEVAVFQVTVISDEGGVQVAFVNVTIPGENDAPSVSVSEAPEDLGNERFRIDATASDPENQNLSYTWVQTGGPEVQIKDPHAQQLVYSTAKVDDPGEVTFALTVSDGEMSSTDTVSVFVDPENSAPTASAGPDQAVAEGSVVQLTSTAADADDDELTYTWTQTGGPAVELSDPSSPSPTFVAPNVLDLSEITFELEVSDGTESTTDAVTIEVDGVNDAPALVAEPFVVVDEGQPVTLSATATDSDSEVITYSWTQTGGTPIAMDGADTAAPSFTAPEGITNSYLTFEVTASDGESSVTSRVAVLVNADNDAPTIDAGADFAAAEDGTVTLAASANDPEGRPLTHTWTQTSGPAVELSDIAALRPQFDAPNVGEDTEITFQLTTSDGEHTVVDTVTVTIEGDNDAPIAVNATTIASEDTPAVVTLGGADPDLGGTVESFRIDILPEAGTLALNGEPVEAGDVISAEAVTNGDLVYTPAADASGEESFAFSAFDGELWSEEPGTQHIAIAGVADAPAVTASDVSVIEDGSAALDITIELADTDGSESISKVRITGAPNGTVFTDGVNDVAVRGGSADVTGLDLSSLQIRPAENHDQDFTLTVHATAEEDGSGDTTVGVTTINVSVEAVNDRPIPEGRAVTILEDEPAPVVLTAREVDTGDAAETFRIETVPVMGTLMLNGEAVEAGDEISAHDVQRGALTFEPPTDWSGQTTFTFSAGDGEAWSDAPATIELNVEGVADAPRLDAEAAAGIEDTAIALSISVAATDTDGSESITSLTVAGAPAGSVFTDGVRTETAIGLPVDITGWDLDNLSVSPSANYDVDFQLTVTATSTEADSGDTATTSEVIGVAIGAVNDAPIAEAGTTATTEDTPVTLRLETFDVDTGDAVESLRIESLPGNGVLTMNGDVVEAGDVLDKAAVDAGGLIFTPETDWSGNTALRFSAFDGEAWSETHGEHAIEVAGVADAATLTVTDASGLEDTPIALDLSSALTDTDGSESLEILIEGVPEGASLSAGTPNDDGTWTLSADQLDGIEVTPPANFSGSFELTVTATTIEADTGDTSPIAETLTVSVAGVADTIMLDVADASGLEDTPISLDLHSALTDTDGSESLEIIIEGVPEGASLSAGTANDNGTWTLSADQLGGLEVTPPANFSGSFDLTVTATTTEAGSGDASTISDSLTVTVAGTADTATLTVADASGLEDTPIALALSSALTDTDGSESLEIVVEGIPEGASLSAGTANDDGTWTLSADELDGLEVTPPANFSGSFNLVVNATTTEAGSGETSTISDSLTVTVAGVSDTAALTVADASGLEDTPIALDLSSALTDIDGSESLEIVIEGMPEGATLSAGTANDDGAWTLSADQLDGLEVNPPDHFSGSFDLSVTAITTEADSGDTSSALGTLAVHVAGVADMPAFTANDATGTEDHAVPLDLSASLIDTDGSESIEVTLEGVPEGAMLSAGTMNPDGSWTLAPADLEGLEFIPTPDFNGSVELTVKVTSTEADSGDTATAADVFVVDITAANDAPTVDAGSSATAEDTPAAIFLSAADSDEGDLVESIRIETIPANGTLTMNGVTVEAGNVIDAADMSAGGLVFTPDAQWSGETALRFSASDGQTWSETQGEHTIHVTAVADAATLEAADASGTEDTAIALNLTAALTDTDGSESLEIVIDGLPDGASLSAGTANPDGTWLLSAADLDGLEVTPPTNFSGNMDLTVTATSIEASNGDAAVSSQSLTVTVDGTADAATLNTADVTGLEDTTIALDLSSSLTDTDGSESLEIVIDGIPEGATLSAGTANDDGSYSLSADQLGNLEITPPADFSGSFDLTITTTATEAGSGDTASISKSFTVGVIGVADAPAVAVIDSAGEEATAIPLNIDAALTDTDGSESLEITINGVPDGASLSAGSANPDGTWTIEPNDLADLEITPPEGFTGSMDLLVNATAVESQGGDATTTTKTVTIEVIPVEVDETPIAEPAPQPESAPADNTATDAQAGEGPAPLPFAKPINADTNSFAAPSMPPMPVASDPGNAASATTASETDRRRVEPAATSVARPMIGADAAPPASPADTTPSTVESDPIERPRINGTDEPARNDRGFDPQEPTARDLGQTGESMRTDALTEEAAPPSEQRSGINASLTALWSLIRSAVGARPETRERDDRNNAA